jgi:alpha-galactosidase
VRFDTTPDLIAHGVYSADRREGLLCVAKVASADSLVPAPLVLPGLVADERYRVERVALPGGAADRGPARTTPAWMRDGAVLSGRQLAVLGLPLPVLNPETALLVHLHAIGPAQALAH